MASQAAAAPFWGDFKADQCTSVGYRQHSAILWDIPFGQSWEATCASMPATINGHYFASPSRCVNTGANMWGEFDVPDATCNPYWGGFQADRCTAIGVRQYSAVLQNIPPGVSWETTCASWPATVNSQYFARPTRCVNTGLSMWGEFDVADASCPHWGDFQRDDCTEAGRRQYSAILWDIADGVSWEEACAEEPGAVAGRSFAHATRCVNTGLNMWGEFDVDDPTCRAVTECTNPSPPAGAFAKTGNNGTVSCDAFCANRDFNWGTFGRCVKARVDDGANAGACIRCTDVGRDFGAGSVTCHCAPPLTGFADLHNHQFANLGFGGLAFHGEAFGPLDGALNWCDGVHGPGGLGDAIANLLGSIFAYGNAGPGHLVGGYPQFDGWPRWNSTTHQAVYEDWLYRAYAGGLRLMVMLAVNNQDIFNAPLFAAKAPGRTASDMEAIRLQIAAAYAMQSHIDLENDGEENGNGWYQIVTTPEQARQVIAAGRLAVVLGVEVDYLFDCKTEADCDEATILAGLNELHVLGVRHVFPIHFKENAFGGAALSHHLTAGAERDCPEYNHACALHGLTARGRFLVAELMKRKMIIDIDHLSRLSFEDAMSIVEPQHYPVVSSHTGFIDVSRGDKVHEGNLQAQQLARLRDLGGIVGVIVHQGGKDEIATWSDPAQPTLTHTCGNTSQTWAQAYLYAVKQMQGRPVAIGTDFNGMAGLPGPRFGGEACLGNGLLGIKPRGRVPTNYPLAVPVSGPTQRLERSVVGQRAFDINVDGLAHMGMLPDFIEDLKRQGLRPEDIEPFYRSAEGYVAMWETIVAVTVPPDFSGGSGDGTSNGTDGTSDGGPAEGPGGCGGCQASGTPLAVILGMTIMLLGRRRRREDTV